MKLHWKSSGRRGSALLIVLGMFAFMLVSAVSFSVFMRASRAPSSYVRRNASARHLVKAALARAMDEIDTAIGNDPFPGVGYNHDYGGNGINQGDRRKNDNWHGRVFTPSNEVAHADTVSTLTLEGLGYLPPCLINEVRYWSRHTRTAKWHSFNYGLGQYAFTAVNVSDLFELNSFIDLDGSPKQRLNRSSSDHGRISPTYLFRSSNEGNMGSGGGLAAAFLNAMADGSGFGVTPSFKEVPFVSLMDFNLALGGNALGGIASPFVKRLQGSSGTFYSSVGDEIVRRQVFMAGGWNGDSNLAYQAYSPLNRVDLRYPEMQPFYGLGWFEGDDHSKRTLANCYNAGTDYWRRLIEHFPVLSFALMCDYLDVDSVPVSLCIPSVEANPMICGVNLNDDCVKYKTFIVPGAVVPPAAGSTIATRIDEFKLKVKVEGLEPTLTSVYPYQSGSQGFSSSYSAEAFARVFFVAEDSTKDGGDVSDDGIRNGFFSLGDNFNWKSVQNKTAAKAYMEVKGSGNVRVPTVNGRDMAAERSTVENIPIRAVNHEWDYVLARLTYEIDTSTTPPTEKLISVEDPGEFDLHDKNFNRVDIKAAFEGNSTVKYRPSVAIWAHIKDSDGKTVDMVPAIPAYDSVNGLAGNAKVNNFNRITGAEKGAPALRFFAQKSDAAAGIELNETYFRAPANNAERSAAWKQKTYMANDPRYNWAPEQWWAEDKTVNPKDVWIDRIKDFREKNNWCDVDIFMSVSDQGYLQSMYEWLLIPQTRDCRHGSIGKGPEWGDLEQNTSVYDGVVRTSADNVAHSGLMWRTYRSRAFNDGNDSWDWGLLDDIPFDDSGAGLRVNPYTDITNVMFGAFANMPRDWWAAGTNWQYDAEKNYMKEGSTDFKNTEDYLFKWSYEYRDVYAMTAFWMNAFRKDPRDSYRTDDWVDAFDGFTGSAMDILDWSVGDVLWEPGGVDVGRLETILQNEMSLADRKFLYGYLKGCFANNHQLFLVFVRAEAAAGGGGAGSGARAVALVWRDPNPPSRDGQFVTATGGTESPDRGKDNASKYLYVDSGKNEESWRLNERKYPPHRMRVLFYHQLD